MRGRSGASFGRQPTGIGELVLSFAEDGDDHRCDSWTGVPGSSSRAGFVPSPTSALSFARSSSTAFERPSCASWRSMSSGAELRDVLERPRGLELRDRVRARLHVRRLLQRSLHRQPDIGHLLADAGRGRGDLHLRSAAEYCALMTSFLVRKASTFACSFCSESISFCCWSSSCATCWSSDCISPSARCLRSSAARARSSRPAGIAWRAAAAPAASHSCSPASRRGPRRGRAGVRSSLL